MWFAQAVNENPGNSSVRGRVFMSVVCERDSMGLDYLSRERKKKERSVINCQNTVVVESESK